MLSRVKWAAALCFVLLALPAGFYQWPMSSALAVEETSLRLSHSLGLELRRPARVRLSLLPTPTLHLVDVEVRGKDGTIVLTAPEASVRLAMTPLLAGKFEYGSAKLRQPTFLVDLDSRPSASGSAISTAMATTAGSPDPTPLGALEIQSGLVRIVSATRGIDTIVEDVDGMVDWPTLDSALQLDLKATWRDEGLAITARIGALAELLKGGRSNSLLSIASNDSKLRLEGDIFGAPTEFEGSISADVASVAALKRVLGIPGASAPSDGPFGLIAKMTTNAEMVTLSAMRLTIQQESFEGALAFTEASKRLTVSGTLATDQFNLQPLLARAPPMVDPTGEWSATRFDIASLSRFDFDLRISAARVNWRDHPVTDVAVELLNEGGRLTATLAEATAYNGLLKAEVVIAPAPAGFQTHASASLTGVDAGALCSDLGWSAYSGLANGEFVFDAVGDSPAALAHTLEGSATIQLAPGVIDGLSFEEALRRSARRSIDVFNDMRMGRTVFAQGSASLEIARGGVGPVSASLTGPAVSVSLDGSLDIPARRLSARATAIQTDEAGSPVAKGPRLDLDIAGPWSAPTIKPVAGGG